MIQTVTKQYFYLIAQFAVVQKATQRGSTWFQEAAASVQAGAKQALKKPNPLPQALQIG